MENPKLIHPEIQVPSPLIKLDGLLPLKSFIKRDDLIHREVSGNKFRKLKYIVANAIQEGKKGIVTFGGPFSNHIYATAVYSHILGLSSIGIIRGEKDTENPTLKFVMAHGMKLYFISRSEYKDKESDAINAILTMHPDYAMIPEGGAHSLAIKGIQEMMDELSFEPDYIACSVGTGTSAAGILRSIIKKDWNTKVLAFSSMKNNKLKDSILHAAQLPSSDLLIFVPDFHYGGYAKLTKELMAFDKYFRNIYNFRLDPIYTLKLVYGLKDYFRTSPTTSDKTIVIYHSGGVQGWDGVEYLNSKNNLSE